MGPDAVNKMPATSREPTSRPASTDSISRLVRPFRCPSTARSSDKPARKRRKINYVEADVADVNDDGAFVSEDRQPLTPRDANRYPVFKVKDKGAMFRQRFLVPMQNKKTGEYDAFRPAPLLGMRRGVVFVAKPLHDPSGEFAIVLYDPTLDDKAVVVESTTKDEEEKKKKEEGKEVDAPKLDAPIVHKSLADILGLKKKVEERPRVPVVIDPRLAKVLRPHQIEGVKVRNGFANCIDGLLISVVLVSMHYWIN